MTFACSPPVSLTAGSYYAELTSPAPNAQSTAYFIKGYSSSVVASGTTNNDVVPGTTTTNSAGLNLEKYGTTALLPGGVQQFEIFIGNSGTANIASGTTVTLRDQLPAGVTATAVAPITGLSSASCTPLNQAGALLTCTFVLNAQLAGPTNATAGPAFNITATMPATAGSLTNWASIDPLGGTAYPAPVNCTLPPCTQQTTTVQAASAPLLTIAKAAPTIVYAGTRLTYTVSIGNSGTAALASGTTFTVLDQLWAGTTFVSAAPSTGVSAVSCNAGVSPMSCSVTLGASLAAGTSTASGAQFTITITAPSSAPNDAFGNYVSVSANGTGTPPAPGAACAVDQCASVGTRLAFPGVQLTKTGPATAVAGSTVTYTIRLGNSASGITIPSGTVMLVSDQLPLTDTYASAAPVSGVSPVSCSSSANGLVSCSVTLTADLVAGTAPGSGPAFTITATVDPLHVGTDTNYASVAPDGVSAPPTAGPTCQDLNCGLWTTTVSTAASLTLAKSAPATVATGSTFDYTLRLGNGGTGPLAGGTVVRVSDQLPTGTTYVSAAAGAGVTGVTCTASAGLVSCQVTLAANLAAGTQASAGPAFTIRVTAPSTTGSTTNYASVATDGTSTPPTPSSACGTANCASALTTATAPSVVLEKGAPSTALAGSSVAYTLNLGNVGTGDLAAGTVILLKDQLPTGATYVSAAGVSGLAPVSCSSTGGGLVSCSVTLTAALTAGTAAASGPVLSITVTAPSTTGSTTNYASVAPDGTTTPPAPGVNCTTSNCGSALTSITAVPVPSVVLQKVAPSTALAGSNITYTLSLGNTGTGDLAAGTVIQVKDQLPTNASYVSAAGVSGLSPVTCSSTAGGLVSCSVTLTAALAAGTAARSGPLFTITATAPSATGATTNYASVATDGTSTPPAPGVNCTTANCGLATTSITAPSVVLHKGGPSMATIGSNVTYTLNLGNLGTADLPAGTVVQVADQLPPGATYVSAGEVSGLSPVSCTSTAGGLVTCFVTLTAPLPAGTRLTTGPSFSITATAPSATGQITNYASVNPDGTATPPTPGVNCTTTNCDLALTTLTAGPAPSVVLQKVAPSTAVVGSNVTYVLNLGNDGTADLSAGTVVQVDDQLPAGATFVFATDGAGVTGVSCTSSVTGLVSCSMTLTAPLVAGTPAGSGPSFSLTATAPSAPGATTNYAAVASDGTSTPPTPSMSCATLNCGAADTNITAPSVVLQKVAPSTAVVGSTVAYTFNLGNAGTADLANGTVIRVDDQLPAGSTYVSAIGVSGLSPVSCTSSPTGLVSCLVTLTTTLAAGATVAGGPSFSITASAPNVTGSTTNYAAVAPDGTSAPPVPGMNCTTANCAFALTAITAPRVILEKLGPSTAVARSIGLMFSAHGFAGRRQQEKHAASAPV